MQPDPRVFLPAIRREILRPDFLGKALTDGLTPILVMRAAEGLAQLEFASSACRKSCGRLRNASGSRSPRP